MCDYSLMNVPNRLATEEEELITYRFPSGSIGLITVGNMASIISQQNAPSPGLFRSLLSGVFCPSAKSSAIAVCIPPGARLQMPAIPKQLQRRTCVSDEEEVVFTQVTAAQNRYRDAIRFRNGAEILLQELQIGQLFRVLDLASADQRTPVVEEPTAIWS